MKTKPVGDNMWWFTLKDGTKILVMKMNKPNWRLIFSETNYTTMLEADSLEDLQKKVKEGYEIDG